MVTATHRQSVLICERGQIVRMRGLHYETDKRATVCTRSEDAHPGQLSEAFHRVTSKLCIVLENCRASNPLDVIDGGGEPDRTGNVRRAGFKSMRCFFEGAFFQSNANDHLAATVPWRNGIENLSAPIERTDAGWPTHFVSGEGEEIAAQLAHVDWQMSRALGRVHQRKRADDPRFLAEFSDWIDCPERI